MIIALLDDERPWLMKAESTFLKYANENNLSIDLLCFENGQELLSYDEKTIDVAFIDIQLQDENGIIIAAEINKKWPSCQIVYCTDYLFYAVDVYETSHTYYFLKSQIPDLQHNRKKAGDHSRQYWSVSSEIVRMPKSLYMKSSRSS